jgi:hypothetical protein
VAKKLIFLPDGRTHAFDEQGERMPEIQRAWLSVFADFLDEHDEDPTEFEITLPDGTHVRVLENEHGWYGKPIL